MLWHDTERLGEIHDHIVAGEILDQIDVTLLIRAIGSDAPTISEVYSALTCRAFRQFHHGVIDVWIVGRQAAGNPIAFDSHGRFLSAKGLTAPAHPRSSDKRCRSIRRPATYQY